MDENAEETTCNFHEMELDDRILKVNIFYNQMFYSINDYFTILGNRKIRLAKTNISSGKSHSTFN